MPPVNLNEYLRSRARAAENVNLNFSAKMATAIDLPALAFPPK